MSHSNTTPKGSALRPMATRSLRTERGSEVTVKLFEPVMLSEETWECEFEISGLPAEVRQQAPGNDGLQAIIVAIDGIRAFLERSGETLTWGEDGEPGDFGITRYIPYGFGIGVEKRLWRLVSDELDRMVEEKKARGRPPPSSKT